MKSRLILLFPLLLLVLPVTGYESNITRLAIVIPERHFGSAVGGLAEHPYRISVLSESVYPVPYPELMEGQLDVDVDNIVSSHAINIVVSFEFNISFIRETGKSEYILEYTVLNETIEANSEYSFSTEEIEHGTKHQLENDTYYPINSYYYLGEFTNSSIVNATLGIYLEHSNHSVEWESDVRLSANFGYNGDTSFYRYLEDRIANSNETETPFLFVPIIFALLVDRIRKSHTRNIN